MFKKNSLRHIVGYMLDVFLSWSVWGLVGFNSALNVTFYAMEQNWMPSDQLRFLQTYFTVNDPIVYLW